MFTIGINLQKLYVDTLIAMGEDPNLAKEDLNENTSPYWNDGREVYYKGEWELLDNVPTPIN